MQAKTTRDDNDAILLIGTVAGLVLGLCYMSGWPGPRSVDRAHHLAKAVATISEEVRTLRDAGQDQISLAAIVSSTSDSSLSPLRKDGSAELVSLQFTEQGYDIIVSGPNEALCTAFGQSFSASGLTGVQYASALRYGSGEWQPLSDPAPCRNLAEVSIRTSFR